LGINGVDAIYWNPANLARGEHGFEASFSHMTYLADIGVEYGAFGINLGEFGTLGLAIKSLDIGDIENTTIINPDGTGQTFSPQYMVLGVTYSKMLSDRVSFGITANYVSETIDLVANTGFSFDIGVTYKSLGSIEGLSLAIAMKNLGTDMQFDGSGLYIPADAQSTSRGQQSYKVEAATFPLPTTLDIGLGYEYDIDEMNALQVMGVFTNHNFFEDEYKVGVEYGFDNLLFLRGGYTISPELDSEYEVYGLTAGVGLNYDMDGMALRVDYAYRAVDLPGQSENHVISLGVGF
ncbi:PorV/PorQ family protein, partial [Lutibacter sp.]|uniref:PorV/PorQ family protein n=1 Tax=Lutibacter sp. TaxID=1925666 RepID=UPI001A2A819D